MQKKFEVKVTIKLKAPIEKVWDALINPDIIKEYMFGTNVVSNWQEESPLIWKGEWQGNVYEEKGRITRLIPEKMIQYTRYNALSGLADIPENYNTITVELSNKESEVLVALTEDNNSTSQAKERSESVWKTMLDNLKEILES